MSRTAILPATIAAIVLTSGGFLRAAEQQADAIMKRMRDQLKNVMVQLQAAQTEKGAAQAALAESEMKVQDLTEKLAAANKKFAELNKQNAADKAAAEKDAAELNAKIANREQQLAQTTESLAKWKTHDQQAVELLKKTDAERANYRSKSIELERKVAERERQNLELYQTGSEILKRYENFGLGKALLAREPFVGTMRVKMETLIQDYRDKLQDQKVKPADKKQAAASPMEQASQKKSGEKKTGS